MKITGLETEIEKVIFAKGDDLGKVEKLAFNTTKDVHISFSWAGEVILDLDIEGIESHLDSKPDQVVNATSPKIMFTT